MWKLTFWMFSVFSMELCSGEYAIMLLGGGYSNELFKDGEAFPSDSSCGSALNAPGSLPPLPYRASGSTAMDERTLLTCGGSYVNDIDDTVGVDQCFTLDLESQFLEWKPFVPLTEWRYGHSLTTVGKKFVAIGGTYYYGTNMEIFQNGNWTQAAYLDGGFDSFDLSGHCATPASDYELVFLFGYANRKINIETGQVTVLPVQPSGPKLNVGCVKYRNGIISAGGANYNSFISINTVEFLELDSEVWTTMKPLNQPRFGLTLTILNGLPYALGDEITSEVYVNEEWNLASKLIKQREGHSAAIIFCRD